MNINTDYSQLERTNPIQRDKNLGKNEFFKILSAQLQYQDPMKGGDNTEFVAQMAQFSSLEQMQNLNQSFEKLMYSQNAQYGTSLVGKKVNVLNGENIVNGEVEKVRLNGSNVSIVIDNKEYPVENVLEIENIKPTLEAGSEVDEQQDK
ncbi:MAG: flagellar hook capping protein [Firmicutes bacterium]|nr:flagellar hook capping protein [Bacillota bacterium]